MGSSQSTRKIAGMYKYPAMKFPRCLLCSRILFLRTSGLKKKKIVRCSKCGLEYARDAIKDANPARWRRVRKRNLFQIKVDSNGRKILQHQGLGGRGWG